MENNLQPPVGTPTPPQTPVEPPVLPRKSNLLVTSLVIIEIITLLFAGYFAYQFSQLKKQIAIPQVTASPVASSTLPTNEPTPIVKATPEGAVTWKTDGIQMKATRTEAGGPTSWLLSYDIPTIWTFETKSRENDSCGNFVFTSSDKLLTLNMDIVCNGWSANYTPWPDSAVIIGTLYSQGNDGHTTYKLRYFDSSKNQYLYTDADATPGTLDKSKTPIDNAVLISYKNGAYDSYFQVGMITLTYKGIEAQKNSYLEKADRIINSLILK